MVRHTITGHFANYFFWCEPEQAIEQTVELSLIWDRTLMRFYPHDIYIPFLAFSLEAVTRLLHSPNRVAVEL